MIPSPITSIGFGNAEEPAGWRKDPELAASVSIHLDSPDSGSRRGRRTLGEALRAIDSVRQVDFIADAVSSARIPSFHVDGMPLGEALNTLARMTSHRWWKQDDVVYLRSLSYGVEKMRDPPA